MSNKSINVVRMDTSNVNVTTQKIPLAGRDVMIIIENAATQPRPILTFQDGNRQNQDPIRLFNIANSFPHIFQVEKNIKYLIVTWTTAANNSIQIVHGKFTHILGTS